MQNLNDNDKEKRKTRGLTCKLTTPELKERKSEVIANLKRQILRTRELKNGFAYRFPGADSIVDELAAFVKTERACCNFFRFTLSISGNKSETWLKLAGPKGAKDFIKAELEL